MPRKAKPAPVKSKPTKTASQRGRSSRVKGKVFERLVANDFRAIYGDRVKRGWQAREGHDAPDIENVPFWVECKHHAKVSIQAALQQARDESARASSRLPVLVVAKDTGERPLAVLDWSEFTKLLARAEAGAPKVKQVEVEVAVFKPAQP